jgi:hypothetical protein
MPEMWKTTLEELVAPPVIVLLAVKTCFKSKVTTPLASIAICEQYANPAKLMLNVVAESEALVATIFVTTVVVDDGTVYSTVARLVVAVPLKSLFAVLAINHSIYLEGTHNHSSFHIYGN